jgi:hypothetical protein
VDDQQMVRRFIQEACAMLRPAHPHIARTHSIFEGRGTCYLAMQFLPGEWSPPWSGRLVLQGQRWYAAQDALELDGLWRAEFEEGAVESKAAAGTGADGGSDPATARRLLRR